MQIRLKRKNINRNRNARYVYILKFKFPRARVSMAGKMIRERGKEEKSRENWGGKRGSIVGARV